MTTKNKVDGISISVGKAKPGVYIHRGFDHCNMYLVTPSSLRRAQRAQLALFAKGQAG